MMYSNGIIVTSVFNKEKKNSEKTNLPHKLPNSLNEFLFDISIFKLAKTIFFSLLQIYMEIFLYK